MAKPESEGALMFETQSELNINQESDNVSSPACTKAMSRLQAFAALEPSKVSDAQTEANTGDNENLSA